MEGYATFSLLLFVTVVVASVQGDPKELDVRLVTTSTTYTRGGRVEVFHDGQWGSVCDEGFGMEDADVVCKQWGYPSGASRVRYLSTYGEGTGPFWLSNVNCAGTEAKLTDCPADPWGQTDCSRDQEAGVICRGSRTEKREEEEWGLYNMREQQDSDDALKKKEVLLELLAELLAEVENK